MYLTSKYYSPFEQRISDTWQPFFGAFNFEKMKYTDKEIWKDVPDYEGYYQVSSHGRLKSLDRYVRQSRRGYVKRKGKKISLKSGNGYLIANLYKQGKLKTINVHILVAKVFLPYDSKKPKEIVDHKDNNKTNNHVTNLQFISMRENCSKDQWRHNRISKYVGVTFSKRGGWKSAIRIHGRLKHLGYFTTEIMAHLAYQKALEKINSES